MPDPHLTGDSFLTPPPALLTLPQGFRFRSGKVITPFSIAYETFGELNADRSNAILVCHALSPSAHAAGKYSESDQKAGWWDGLIGYGKAFDLRRDFVVCVNLPGSCWGTTAPSSIDPATNRAYGSAYPAVTIHDMVEAEKAVIDALGISRLRAVAGGSLGGMQVLMWGVLYPDRVASLISMAAAAAVPVEGMAWHVIGRKIIESDPAFRGGDYYDGGSALRGLEVARMVGHMTYLSQEALERKFGRRRRASTRQFEIDSYLEYQGNKFAQSYDANSYVRVQAAMDEMDLEEEFGSLRDAFARYSGNALLISFDTDWLFPPAEILKLQSAFSSLGIESEYHEIATTNGHDAFLVDYDLITPLVSKFLSYLPKAAS